METMKRLLMVALLVGTMGGLSAQNRTVGFYNLENLFDTIDDPHKNDNEYLPDSKNPWNTERYHNKLTRLSEAILMMGDGKVGPHILGVCEAENVGVLRDLVNQPALKKSDYGYVLVEGPDPRGIDVALLFRKKNFKLLAFRSIPLLAEDMKTRDQLLVTGVLDGDTMHFIVNHWPSRLGGQERSEPKRVLAANLCRSTIDSLYRSNAKTKVIVMGDFNDDPTDTATASVLAPKGSPLINVSAETFAKGEGTLEYRGKWNLFDQMFVSVGLVQGNTGYRFLKYEIVKRPELLEQEGKYAGTPFRTMAGGKYLNGYSDHLPVRLVLGR